MAPALAPDLGVSEWIGEPHPLAGLRGRVVLVETFQMLSPGCVSHGLPRAMRVQDGFPDVVVLGLHTVFEHHDAMTPLALRAFLGAYRITFPVGVDRHDDDPGSSHHAELRAQGHAVDAVDRPTRSAASVLVRRRGRPRLHLK